MAQKQNQSFKVVWAKVRGYPWWPGVVKSTQIELPKPRQRKQSSDDSSYLVRFIGEKTQYFPKSSNLHENSIKDFNENLSVYSNLKNKVNFNQKLTESVDQALLLLNNELTLNDLFSSDTSKSCKSTSNKELKAKFKAIQEALKTSPTFESSDSPDDFHRQVSFLAQLSKLKMDEVSITIDLCEALFELVRMKVSSSVLQKSKILNVLKMISKVCQNSECPTVGKLGRLIKALKKHYKGILKFNDVKDEEHIRDHSLRRTVLQKTAKILEIKSFDKAEAREIALQVEKKIRQKDPSMTKVYNKYIKKMLKDFRRIPPDLEKN